MHVVRKFTSLVDSGQFLTVMVGGSFFALIVASYIKRFIPAGYLVLIYISLIIFPISLGNLIEEFELHHYFTKTMGNWEGVSWLTGTACFSAWILSDRDFQDVRSFTKVVPSQAVRLVNRLRSLAA